MFGAHCLQAPCRHKSTKRRKKNDAALWKSLDERIQSYIQQGLVHTTMTLVIVPKMVPPIRDAFSLSNSVEKLRTARSFNFNLGLTLDFIMALLHRTIYSSLHRLALYNRLVWTGLSSDQLRLGKFLGNGMPPISQIGHSSYLKRSRRFGCVGCPSQ